MSNRSRMPVLNARSGPQNGGGRPGPYSQVRPQMGGPPPLMSGGPPPGMFEQKISTQHNEIQRLLTENQRLAATHVALRQELAAAQQEVQRLNSLVAGIQTEKDAQIRSLLEKAGKLEADLRATENIKQELHQARTDCQKLHAHSQELAQQVRNTNQELQRARAEVQQVPVLRAEMDTLRQELQRARTAFDFEKKANAEQLEQRQAMEKNLVSMARDLEKLRAEATNAEKRSRMNPAGGGPYNGVYGGSEAAYGLMPQQVYGDGYAMHSQEAIPTANGVQHSTNAAETDYSKSLAEAAKYTTGQDANSVYHATTGTQAQDPNLYRTSGDLKPAEEWATHEAPNGKPFYHNVLTGATQWEKPASLETQHYAQAHMQQQAAHAPALQSTQNQTMAPQPMNPLHNSQAHQNPLATHMAQQQPMGATLAPQQQNMVQVGQGAPQAQHGGAQPHLVAGQHPGGYMAHTGAHLQQPSLYAQHPGAYMGQTGTYMHPGSHIQQPGAYLQHSGVPQTQLGQAQQPVAPIVGQMQVPLGTHVPPLHQGQAPQTTAAAPMPHLVHGHLSYPVPGAPSHQGLVQQPTTPHLPPLMPGPGGQQSHLQSPQPQSNQAPLGPRPGAYPPSTAHHQQQQNQQTAQPSPRQGQNPSRASTQATPSPSAQSQSQAQGAAVQAGHAPHVSAAPVIHPRPQVSETTTTPGKKAPPPPPTANSGPQGANLFVFGIPEDMGDKKLADLFAPYGAVIYSKVGVEKDTGRNRTYGFVSMDSSQSAEAAIHQVNGMLISGKRIKVELKRGDNDGHTHQNQQNQQHQHQQNSHQHQAPPGGTGPTRWHNSHNGNAGYRPY